MEQHYIGVKLLKATPMTLGQYNIFQGWKIPEDQDPNTLGYVVTYDDGYISWSPAPQFEKSHLAIAVPGKVSKSDVDGFIDGIESFKHGDRCAITTVSLKNGFDIVTPSSSLPENFSLDIGREIGTDRAKDKIWELLGFLMQTAKYGFTFHKK